MRPFAASPDARWMLTSSARPSSVPSERMRPAICASSSSSLSEASPSVMLKTSGGKLSRCSGRLDEIVDVEQRFVHRGLSRCGGSDPLAHGHLVECGLTVGKAAFDADPAGIAYGVPERGDRNERFIGREERVYAFARITDHGDVVVVAHFAFARGAQQQFRQQRIGDLRYGRSLRGAPSAEFQLLDHRTRLVDGQNEGRAVTACDALGVVHGLCWF